ncbi:VWA domain-containing protein [Shewanella schlegeliana]|uniref:VWA domain-containing protein n=1 Tax=Shewanella schlegeliana TaxID=190308 RepID=A0ABS1T303_9GAMM|nr:VWA domain-containing protein [Shewanella schlegeliana]MBL4915179.1 VWA domain-containing protein [Shewanella schlegeliana]MCL1110953.1 VWA domain-containing protein [Shewanella schlegeliana]GIU29463.1 VWA domain-containing protein [Shewanella schlegeliana]
MLTLTHPWLAILLLLPLLAVLLPKHRTALPAIRFSKFKQLVSLSQRKPSEGAVVLSRLFWQRLLATLTYLALVCAAVRPVWLGEPIQVEQVGREIMVAVDLSGSMEAMDFVDTQGETLRRVEGVKALLQSFLLKRESDRIGLIAFGENAYLQAPFTQDKQILSQLLQEMDVRMAGAGTAIGDAIGVAVNHFEQSEVENKVLLLLTDGNDTSSEFPPLDAAHYAGEQGVVIYPIAIGDPKNVGEDSLDIATLERIAELTQGQVFEADDGQSLIEVYKVLEQLQPQLFESYTIRPEKELYFWPILFVLCINLATLMFVSGRRKLQESQ